MVRALPTSAARTCVFVSLQFPFSITMKSRTDLSPFCMHYLVHSGPAFFSTLWFKVFISCQLLLRDSNISAPFLFFVTSPCCPMFSFGLLAFSILELKSPTNTTSPCLLYFCRDLLLSFRTSSVSPSTLGACRCFLRKIFRFSRGMVIGGAGVIRSRADEEVTPGAPGLCERAFVFCF